MEARFKTNTQGASGVFCPRKLRPVGAGAPVFSECVVQEFVRVEVAVRQVCARTDSTTASGLERCGSAG